MESKDAKALLEFFREISDEERYFLKDDVVSENVISGWAAQLDYDHALPLLAFDGDRICYEADFHDKGSRAKSLGIGV